ncbi:ketopantoate reductase [Lentibacillus persicus]|uniref:2-dehydropantoate 2-reductase n=1 Tax=Lentibacillus persicus TaxID=640948 RepID=A0A1I1X9R9_9BACI|nr:2-dehydropantoate 2-reductase [Lentibacillus persicus]SFE04082.1 ketopantoate reductase [Lentibacillus persicus]
MNIVILGAGALGVYFGGRWLESGAEVSFLVREKRAAQIEANGLKINSTHGDYELKNPHITTEPDKIESPDIVLVGVKGFHLEGTFNQLQTLTEKGAYILPVLNGIEHIEILQNKFGKDRVLGGLSYIFAALNDKGHAEQAGNMHHLYFGPLDPSQEAICEKLEHMSKNSGFISKKSSDMMYELWKKYMFISALSGVTTAANLPIGAVREHGETFHIAKMIMREIQSLAKHYGTVISDDDVEAALQNARSLDSEATSSMHKDRRKGLRLEVDHIQGGAVRMAEEKGLEVPSLRTVLGLIKPFETPE